MPMDRQIELEHLRKADADIASGRRRIARQSKLIAELADRGHDVTTAKSVLLTMQDAMAIMEEYRRLILRELATFEGQGSAPDENFGRSI